MRGRIIVFLFLLAFSAQALTPRLNYGPAGAVLDGVLKDNQHRFELKITTWGQGKVYVAREGEFLKLEAQADAGWHFSHWQGALVGSGNPILLPPAAVGSIVAVFIVPFPYSSLQEAIDLAADGEVITVPPGVYREQIDFKGKAITLKSINPKQKETVLATVIDAGGKGAAVSFITGEGNASIMQGFTITGVIDGDGAIWIKNASPQVLDNIIHGNKTNGIYISGGAPTIARNLITIGIATSRYGAGIVCYGASALICDNTITETPPGSNGISLYRSRSILQGNQISANGEHGILLDSCSTTLIENNIVAGNRGAAISSRYSNECTIRKNTLQNNEGSGIASRWDKNMRIEENIIQKNMNTAGDGGGIFLERSEQVEIVDNLIKNNYAFSGAGIYLSESQALISLNTFSKNVAPYRGGAICFDSRSRVRSPKGSNWPNDEPSPWDDNTYYDNSPENIASGIAKY